MKHSKHPTSALCFLLLRRAGCVTTVTSVLVACGATPTDARRAANDTTEEAQRALVAPLPSLRQSVLEVRDLINTPQGAENARMAPVDTDVVVTTDYDYRGTMMEVASQQAQAEIQAKMNAAGWSREPVPGFRRLFYANVENQKLYLVEVEDDEVRRIGQLADELGVSSPPRLTASGDIRQPASPSLMPMGLSNGNENRVRKPLNSTYPWDDIPLRLIGRTCSPLGCATGSTVGRRLVLTAAHVVVQPDLSEPGVTYRARNNSTTTNPTPFGTETSVGFWWDAQYSGNNCHISYSPRDTCLKWDWAVLLLRQNAWPNGGPGWFGFSAPTANQLAQSQYLADGYSGCGYSYSPPNCVSPDIYGQTTFGNGTGQYAPDPGDNNFPTIFLTNVDVNPGNSGGPFYFDTTVQGIMAWEDCGLCGADDGYPSYPNRVRSMTPWLVGWLSAQRQAYP